jgi:hypothetical protein
VSKTIRKVFGPKTYKRSREEKKEKKRREAQGRADDRQAVLSSGEALRSLGDARSPFTSSLLGGRPGGL